MTEASHKVSFAARISDQALIREFDALMEDIKQQASHDLPTKRVSIDRRALPGLLAGINLSAADRTTLDRALAEVEKRAGLRVGVPLLLGETIANHAKPAITKLRASLEEAADAAKRDATNDRLSALGI
ncbi:MAG: hypothetical protein U1E28_22745 [Beijerinckiaceae bacterium]